MDDVQRQWLRHAAAGARDSRMYAEMLIQFDQQAAGELARRIEVIALAGKPWDPWLALPLVRLGEAGPDAVMPWMEASDQRSPPAAHADR